MNAETKVNWTEDAVKIILQKDDLVIIRHQRTGAVQFAVRDSDGKFHAAELSREEAAKLQLTI